MPTGFGCLLRSATRCRLFCWQPLYPESDALRQAFPGFLVVLVLFRQRPVIDKPGTTEVSGNQHFLFCVRVESTFVGFHGAMIEKTSLVLIHEITLSLRLQTEIPFSVSNKVPAKMFYIANAGQVGSYLS